MNRTKTLLIVAIGLSAILLAACGRLSRLFPTPNPKTVGWHDFSITINTKERFFRVYVPKVMPDNTSAVFVLHGTLQSMREIFADTGGGQRGWVDISERDGILLVVPNGTNASSGDAEGDDQDWNDLRTDQTTKHSTADDVEFLRALHDWLISSYSVNPKRIFITGFSTGGIMVYRTILELPGRFAAAAVFSANLPNPTPRPTNYLLKTPLMLANGDKDPFMKWEGGTDYDIGAMKSAVDTAEWWVSTNNAQSIRPLISFLPDAQPKDGCRILRTFYPANPGGASVMFYKLEGGGHTVPTAKYPLPDAQFQATIFGPVCMDAEGPELAWEFMNNPNTP